MQRLRYRNRILNKRIRQIGHKQRRDTDFGGVAYFLLKVKGPNAIVEETGELGDAICDELVVDNI